MPRVVLLASALSALLIAGCVQPPAEPVEGQSAVDIEGLLGAKTQLWLDPQNAPHPAFGWPTLSNPAAGLEDAGIPTYWQPIPARPLPDSISGIEHVTAGKKLATQGAGIAIFGSLLIVPGYGEPTAVIDISNPEEPKLLGELLSESSHRGAVVIPYPDGTLVTALATGAGFEVFDITDPTMPMNLSVVEPPRRGHKIGVVPGTPIVYNANSQGGADNDVASNAGLGKGATEIYDLSDPANPVLVQEFQNGYGCHHIYFWVSEEKQRALCAGIEYTQIWDIADPLDPKVIVSVPVHHGVVGAPAASTFFNFAHFSILNDDGTILVVGDETGGGSLPPGCDARVDTPVKQLSGPFGNLWFYDVSDETNPRLLGWVGMNTLLPNQTSCTAHHGRLVPDPEGRDMIAMAFYGAGVALIDFIDPMDPRVVDQFADGSDTWEAWYYNGYIFTGDLARGFDVLTFA